MRFLWKFSSEYEVIIFNTNHLYYILPYAIDVNRFHYNVNKRGKMRHRLRIYDEQFVIGHVGRFSEQKNHEFLLDIFMEIHKIDPHSILLLIGDMIKNGILRIMSSF